MAKNRNKTLEEVENMEIVSETQIVQDFDGNVLSQNDTTIEAKLRKALKNEDRKNSSRIRAIVSNIAGETARLSIDKNGTVNVETNDLSIKI
jgi:hypothetical protein